MFLLKGKYNTAKIFTDVVDQESISQVMNLLNQEFVAGSTIRMMPDIHAGAGCTIGTTMTIRDKIVPNLVGVDIGCGMLVATLNETSIDLEKLDQVIHDRIHAGFSKRTSPHRFFKNCTLESMRCSKNVNLLNAEVSLGTLGGGNHFIEVDTDEDGRIYLVIHSGSHHLGLEVASHYQKLAWEQTCGRDADTVKNLIAWLKKEGREDDIQLELSFLKQRGSKVPKNLAYLTGNLMDCYLRDMTAVTNYANWNRLAILDEILTAMGLSVYEQFTTIHNYFDFDELILRKGAVSARKGQKFIIPINMRDGSLICVGKGNPDWNYSAPHGAGRLMSRAQAKERFTVAQYEEQMKDVYTTCVGQATLDECPMAYKGMSDIANNISPTADILKVIKPIYNFKAGNSD